MEYLPLLAPLRHRLGAAVRSFTQTVHRCLRTATKPAAARLVGGTLVDGGRRTPALLAENVLLRPHLIILQRRVKRSRYTAAERLLVVLLTSHLPTWRHALLIVHPETVLRWHRQLFRLWWRRKTRATTPAQRPPLSAETIALIRAMAADNRLRGAERIRGSCSRWTSAYIRVATSTIQTYWRDARGPRHHGQTWATVLRNQGHEIGAADVLPGTALLFRSLYAFVLIELVSRRVMHGKRAEVLGWMWTAGMGEKPSAV